MFDRLDFGTFLEILGGCVAIVGMSLALMLLMSPFIPPSNSDVKEALVQHINTNDLELFDDSNLEVEESEIIVIDKGDGGDAIQFALRGTSFVADYSVKYTLMTSNDVEIISIQGLN